MDGLVWFGVLCTVVGAGFFAFGMRHDPILAAAIPGGTGLVMVVLLYLILSGDAPSPAPEAVANELEQSSERNADPSRDFLEALQSKQEAVGSGETVDLLARVGPRPNVLTQAWFTQNGALVSTEVRSLVPSKMWIPYRPPQSFQLTAVVERLSGNDSINFGFPVGGRDVTVCIDGYGGIFSGINLIDRSTADRNESRRRGPFIRGRGPHTIICTVGPSSVYVTVNGQRAIDWKGDVSRLSQDRRWPNGPPGHIELGTWQSSYRISKLELKPRP